MSPTRRDLLKASAGLVAAAFATPSVIASESPVVTPAIPAPVTIRTAGMLGMFYKRKDHQTPTVQFYFDGDLDGTWTLHVTPLWQSKAMTDEMDFEGIHHCSDLTANQLMELMWAGSDAQRPTVIAADLIEDVDMLFENLGKWSEEWIGELRWKRNVVGVNDLNNPMQHPWSFVVWNHDLLSLYPGANAIIECHGHFYTAKVDKEPWRE